MRVKSEEGGNCTVQDMAHQHLTSYGPHSTVQVVPGDKASSGKSFRKIAGIFYLAFIII